MRPPKILTCYARQLLTSSMLFGVILKLSQELFALCMLEPQFALQETVGTLKDNASELKVELYWGFFVKYTIHLTLIDLLSIKHVLVTYH